MSVELSATDRKVLVASHLRARLTTAEIAAETGLKEHVVRRSLSSMLKSRVIEPTTAINYHLFGVTHFHIFFSRAGETQRTRDALIAFLKSSPRVSWAAEVGGDHQYGISVAAKSAAECRQFLNDMCARSGDKLYEKSFALVVRWHLFSVKYLADKQAKLPSVTFGGGAPVTLDDTDRTLLAAISETAPGLREISRDSGIPLSTLSNRMARLESSGVILAHIYRVNAAAFGFQTFRLVLFERGSSETFSAELFEFAKNHPYIYGLSECLGGWDYEMRVDVPSLQMLNAVITSIHDRFEAEIRSVRVYTVLERHKMDFFPYERAADRERKKR